MELPDLEPNRFLVYIIPTCSAISPLGAFHDPLAGIGCPGHCDCYLVYIDSFMDTNKSPMDADCPGDGHRNSSNQSPHQEHWNKRR